MKLSILLLIITAFALYFSYQRIPKTIHTPQEALSNTTSDTTSTGLLPIPSTLPPTLQQQDSSALQLALEDALRIARPAFQKDNFSTTYTFPSTDSTTDIEVDINMGPLLNDGKSYLLLRRHASNIQQIHLNLYTIQNNKALPLLHHIQSDHSYQKDTIFDVNGDQQADFIVCWYPMAGNWKRDIRTVYLNKQTQQVFSNPYTFENPQFDPLAGIVRGIEYGNPENVGFYKYQWKDFNLDTIAYVYPHPVQKDKYIQVPNKGYLEHIEEGVLLDSLPTEYQSVQYTTE